MVQKQRTTEEKVGDWFTAFTAIRAELTPEPLSEALKQLTIAAATTPGEALTVLQQSLGIARVVCANDRAAAIVASMLTQSGVSRPTFNTEEE